MNMGFVACLFAILVVFLFVLWYTTITTVEETTSKILKRLEQMQEDKECR